MKRYLCFLALCAALAAGQGFQGSLRGRLSDPAGAAIPNAAVTLTDEGTRATRTTLSSDSGEYSFPSLTPATYTIAAEAPGFKRVERNGVIVATQSSVTIDLELPLGQVTESINVTAEAPLLETGNASTGTVIDRQKLVDLPNLGRNPFMMSKLSESIVQNGNPKFNRMQDQSGSSSISIAGGPVRGNNYTLDGISITDSTNRAAIIPSIEAVEEVKVQANTYDAEMGRTGGGTFNTFLKSGTNQMHGSAFGYVRETPWLANNFFSNRAGQPIIEQPFRNYGGSIGGPIRIPKIYDGLNKTFFWITGEAYRQTESAGTRISVPTALERVGDFSQSPSRATNAAPGALQVIYDPLTTTTAGVRQPFTGNIIPANRLSRVGLALASYYPMPTVQGRFYGDPNFDATVPAYNRADQTTWKADHEVASWMRLSGSYLHYGSMEPGNRWFSNIASPNQGILRRKVDATQANATITPGPTWVIAVRYGFNRFPNFSTPLSLGFDLASLGFSNNYLNNVPVSGFPSITMSDLNSFGGSGNFSQSILHSKSFNTTVSKFLGKHSVKMGFDYRLINNDQQASTGPGSFSFNDVFTRATPRSTTVGTGSSLAGMLLGYPGSGSITRGSLFFNYIRYYGLFVQDDWRVSSKLTLNFGLRYEYETAPRDKNNNYIAGFDPLAASPLQQTVADPKIFGTLLYAGVDGNPTQGGSPMTNKYGPRGGFAYQINDKTVVRGGYGIFWAPANFSAQSTLGYSQETPMVVSFDNNFTPAPGLSLENPFPNGLLTPVGNAERGKAGIGRSITAPAMNSEHAGMVQQYSFDFQREVGSSLVLSLGYIGSKSTDLDMTVNTNQLDPQYLGLGSALNQSVANPMFNNGGTLQVGNATIARSQLLKPFPQFTGVSITDSDVGRGLYHALYVKAQRRFSQGLSALVTYTWSQTMALNDSWQNSWNPDADYGLASTHQPHRLSMAFTYELPFGMGKPMVNNNRLLDYVIGGWSINAVNVMTAGYPLAISQNNDNSVIGASSMRPNATGIVPDVNKSFAERIDGFMNPAAFSVAPQFTFGNLAPRVNLRGPGLVNWDVSVFKTFSVGERLKAQFRAEALNFTNTPYFSNPQTNIVNANFGKITAQQNFSRLVQLGIRFIL